MPVITYQRPQVMYSLDIGSTYIGFGAKHEAMMTVAQQISKLTGGCTLIDSVGIWADVERADKESYENVAIGNERNVQLQVKAEVGKEDKVEVAIVACIVAMAETYPELEINWVCGHKVTEEGLTVSFNFSVEENS